MGDWKSKVTSDADFKTQWANRTPLAEIQIRVFKLERGGSEIQVKTNDSLDSAALLNNLIQELRVAIPRLVPPK